MLRRIASHGNDAACVIRWKRDIREMYELGITGMKKEHDKLQATRGTDIK